MTELSDALDEVRKARITMEEDFDAFSAAYKASLARITKVENGLVAAVRAQWHKPAPVIPPLGGAAPVIRPLSIAQRVVKVERDPNTRDGRERRPATDRQLSYIDDLCAEKFARVEGKVSNMLDASQVIGKLKKLDAVDEAARDMSTVVSIVPSAPDPLALPVTPVQDKIDLNVLRLIPNGRYAVANDDETQIVFLRLAERKSKVGNAPHRVVQYKSSDTWNDLQYYWNDGRVTGRNTVHGSSVADLLTQIMMDKAGCADRYGEKFSECVNCGRELTDDKSRYYRLGSECITKRPDLVDYIDNKNGVWSPGAASRD
ncbi:hypothetical protein TIN4_84 [Tsukamurella phage TIN4]|uniref:Uncharacterized protein n=2 Tax=Tinduovirus TIN3 TaxID=1982571 RepID=A0A0K0N5K2_9CAUD|nr:hypothetical protein AVT54_gp041 [Tsukamurella phage TIN3]YP_009604214.1 hypothetical protein FDH87_gp041 [Tsukamurella phage TIN4]AKJ71881.1 hypothetical protein TIN3_84 [Tsukamurella phage TIN3]AKJ71990.1 hypothetical protein TIN4_84 [Tsukamurella phage TIN4]